MTAMLYLIILSLILGAGGLVLFLWTLRTGQYEDIDGAANRVLFDDAVDYIRQNDSSVSRTNNI
ncbi:MAG: cbb3-type cytochrome oxidase assembly protein CcoS [Rhodospirillales bacterium]|nr:cbb3-type cytochrome oxidase assembly protein CcoS [Rhodospirillales bacterium]MDE2574159.1 cbb3-type cytochrome oxidase assembly protein CcoS [Rhodospirillales bacterium]